MPVYFHAEDISFPTPLRKGPWKRWLTTLAKEHQRRMGELNYIFCSDDYLLQMNRKYLQHDTLTDIITFDNSDEPGVVEGDIYISVDRVGDNARAFGVTVPEELARVMAHGLLHLCGFGDKTPAQKKEMRKQEELALGYANIDRELF